MDMAREHNIFASKGLAMRLTKVLLACVLAMNMLTAPALAFASEADSPQNAAVATKSADAPSKDSKQSSDAAPSKKDGAESANNAHGSENASSSDSDKQAGDEGSSSGSNSSSSESSTDGSSSSKDDSSSETASDATVEDKEDATTDKSDADSSSVGESESANNQDGESSAISEASEDAEKSDSSDSEKGSTDSESSEKAEKRTNDSELNLASLDESRKIEKIVIKYRSADASATTQPKEFDPDDKNQTVSITKKGGKLELYATIYFDDGTKEESTDNGSSVKWKITSMKTTAGKDTPNLLAIIEKKTSLKKTYLSAMEQGNGKVKVVCSSSAYPDFRGQAMTVEIKGNAFDSSGTSSSEAKPKSIVYGYVFWNSGKNDGVGSPAMIVSREAELNIDFMVTFSDGTHQAASELGIGGTFAITKTYDTKGATSRATIAKVNQSGDVFALGKGNGSVSVEITSPALVGQDDYTLRVKISNNGIVGTQDPVPVSLQFSYTDAPHGSNVSYSESRIPMIDEERGKVTFQPKLVWNDGSVTNANDSIYYPKWQLVKYTDEDDKVTKTALGILSPSGVFTATNSGNGYAYVSCTLSEINVNVTPSVMRIKIINNNNIPYVESISILGSDGRDLGDGGIDTSKVGSAQHFYALVKYSDKTQKSTLFGDKIEGLEWKTVRGLDNSTELYSHINDEGVFFTDAGFVECRVLACVKEGSKYGKDVSKAIRVYDGKETERVGYTSSITAHIVYESQYRKFGNSAQSAKDIDITVNDLKAKGAPYSDWFTFRTKGGNWGTIYANGVSITKLLAVIGVEVSDMQFMQFSDKVGYTGDSGFYSADVILGSRYRYSNYYMHPISSSPAYLGQSSVVPMLATSMCFDYGNDYNGSGFSKMSPDSTLRLIMGMTGIEDGNGRRLVRCVSDITVIVNDPPTDEENRKPAPSQSDGKGDGNNGTGGSSNTGGTGNGMGSGTGDGINSGEGGGGGAGSDGSGQAMDGSGGGTGVANLAAEGGGGQSQASDNADDMKNDSSSLLDGQSMLSDDGTMLLRELSPEEIKELPIPNMDLNNPFRPVAVVLCIGSFLLGAVWYERRFRKNKIDFGRRATA